MALRNIIFEGDPCLNKVCKEVKDVDDHIRELIDDLTDTMKDANGVGLAAPQVGVLRRVCVVEISPEDHYELVNPRIIETDGDQYGEEGCLSVPGKAGNVHRPNYVKVEALDRNGNKVVYEGTELLARAFCHEIDHLDGIVYTSKAEGLHTLSEE